MSGMGQYDTGGSQNGVSSRQRPSRPLSFRESLPYSPQTTTLPFVPDLIPNPTLGSGSSVLSTSDILPSTDLDQLNKEAEDQGHLSRNGKQAAESIIHEIKPSQRTQYKFCQVPKGSATPKSNRVPSGGLSFIAKTVYERVGTYFKDTKPNVGQSTNGPVKASPKLNNKPSASSLASASQPDLPTNNIPPPQRPSSSKIEVAIPTNSTFDRSAYIDPQALTNFDAPVAAAPASGFSFHEPPPNLMPMSLDFSTGDTIQFIQQETTAPAFRVELPKSQINRDEYMEVTQAPEAPQNLSRRKERHTLDTSQGLIGESVDQRQRGQSALNELYRRLDSINKATRAAFNMEPGSDHSVTLNDDQEPILAGDEHKKLHGAIQKVISMGSFIQVPVENLTQVLRFSETNMKEGLAVDAQIDKDWDEAGVESWALQLATLETALKAARTSMRILSGGREDRQLYSESIIENTIKIFQKTVDEVINPIVELRSSGPSANIFKLLLKHKKDISTTFVTCQKLLALLAYLIAKVQLSDLAVNTLEFVTSNLIFVENAYYEKDSIAGVQKFDGIRSTAMDTLCQIFLIKPEQRQGILNEILTSLSKLPASKQSSRQFKLSDGGSIQPVSALIMRLVQASSTSPDSSKDDTRAALMESIDDAPADEDMDELSAPPKKHAVAASITSEQQGAEQPGIAIQDLLAVTGPLGDDAQRNASLVINFLVQRAAGSSKSGETPYRNLLDLCVDDFTTCLDSTEWPSAELLLRCLMSSMVILFEGDKTSAPVKNMALEVLGNMTSAISRLRSHMKRIASTFESHDMDELSRYLAELANHTLDRDVRSDQLVLWAGPYRIALEALQAHGSENSHIASAASFLMINWASRIRASLESSQGFDVERDREFGRLAYRLRMMIEDRNWLTSQFEFNSVTANQNKLSYTIILLGSPLCEAYDRMLNILLRSMTSDQATVRSKSLKSISLVLETDPTILDGDSSVVGRILECARDPSIQVRESALGLMGNCISLRPKLEATLIPHIMDRVSDAGVSVRRRAMKLARDIYLRNRDMTLRSNVASGLLRRVTADLDESVRDAAKQMVEEIWFVPFYQMDDTAVAQTSLAEHASLIIRTVRTGGINETLDKVFQSVLKGESKGPMSVCSKLVSNMFGLINNPDSDDPSQPSGRDALQVLTLFAKAEPKLFTFEQTRLLKPQLATSNVVEEVATFRAVVIILKCVLPQLSTVHTDFVNELKSTLVPKLGKVSDRAALSDLAACVRVICDLLKNVGPIAALARSALGGVQKLGAQPKGQVGRKVLGPLETRKLRAYSVLLGTIAQHFELDSEIEQFKAVFRNFQGDSVARLIVDTLTPYTAMDQSLDTRKAAIDGIASVCQAWPRNYTIPKIWTVFQQAFEDQDQQLEHIILRSFKEFLLTEERRSEASAQVQKSSEKKSLTVMGGTNFDDVASATTQRFLKDITRISLASQDAHALLALEVLGSINRQGLTHPKETGVTLITLETSANKKISELAFQEHRALHEKHESTIEREYTKAIQSAYEYQRDIVKDTRGATIDPPQSKLHNMMDVMKISKMKNRQRFFEKLCGQLDFDWTQLETHQEMPPHFDFTRFVVENMAFFEYQTVGELQITVHKLESLVTGLGAPIAQAIDTEIFNVRMDVNVDAQIQQQLNGEESHGQAPEVPIPVDQTRLRYLATASMILLLIWEVRTYLRRLYGMGSHRHDSKAKALSKDLNRSPTKTQGVHWEKFWEEATSISNGLKSQELMMHKCKGLVELMNVDKELKVADDDEDMEADGPGTPSSENDDGQDRGRKRKAGGTPGGRKKRARSGSQARKRGRPRKNANGQSPDDDSEVDWF